MTMHLTGFDISFEIDIPMCVCVDLRVDLAAQHGTVSRPIFSYALCLRLIHRPC